MTAGVDAAEYGVAATADIGEDVERDDAPEPGPGRPGRAAVARGGSVAPKIASRSWRSGQNAVLSKKMLAPQIPSDIR